MGKGDESGTRATDLSSLHRYRTEIPNIIDDMDLSVYAFRLYVRLKRVAGDNGKCFYSTRELAEQCRMSVGAVSKAKQELVEKDLIRIENDGRWERDNITIVDMWPANFAYFAQEKAPTPCSPHEQIPEATCSPHEQTSPPPVHHMNSLFTTRTEPVHHMNTKEEPYKEITNKEEPKGERGRKAPTPPQHHHFDSRKFVNGKVPAGTGSTPAEVFYEVHTLQDDRQVLSSHALATITEKVDDLARWRAVVSEWELCSYKATNIKGQLDWYRDGIPQRASPANGNHLRGNERAMATIDEFVAEYGDIEITSTLGFGGLP